jgi:RNA polymerase sigma factor (sigma-70 family)
MRDEQSRQRQLVRNNGADFRGYHKLRGFLIQHNYPLVVTIARNYGRNTFTDDLCQEGVIGLCDAVDTFRPSHGAQFSTFAHLHIRKSMLAFMKTNHLIRISSSVSYLSKVAEEAFDRLVQDNWTRIDSIDADMLAREVRRIRHSRNMRMKITTGHIRPHLERLKMQASSTYPDFVDPETYYKDSQVPPDSLYYLLTRILEKDLLKQPIKQAEIIKMRFGLGDYKEPMDTEEIASILCVTPRYVDLYLQEFFEGRKKRTSGIGSPKTAVASSEECLPVTQDH